MGRSVLQTGRAQPSAHLHIVRVELPAVSARISRYDEWIYTSTCPQGCGQPHPDSGRASGCAKPEDWSCRGMEGGTATCQAARMRIDLQGRAQDVVAVYSENYNASIRLLISSQRSAARLISELTGVDFVTGARLVVRGIRRPRRRRPRFSPSGRGESIASPHSGASGFDDAGHRGVVRDSPQRRDH